MPECSQEVTSSAAAPDTSQMEAAPIEHVVHEFSTTESDPNAADLMPVGRERRNKPASQVESVASKIGSRSLAYFNKMFDIKGRSFRK